MSDILLSNLFFIITILDGCYYKELDELTAQIPVGMEKGSLFMSE